MKNVKLNMARRFSPGLTLMELILGMTILTILLAIVSPLVSQVSSGYKLRAAAREVASDLQFARLLAVKENKEFQVVFNANSYQVLRTSDGGVAKIRNFGADYPQISLNNLAVTFNSRGNATSRTITVSNAVGSKNITVGSTGRVKLE